MELAQGILVLLPVLVKMSAQKGTFNFIAVLMSKYTIPDTTSFHFKMATITRTGVIISIRH
jgi:hypothetical protein